MDVLLISLPIGLMLLLVIVNILVLITQHMQYLLSNELSDTTLTLMGNVAENRWSILNQLLVLDGATDANVQELYDNIIEERIRLAEDVTVEALLADNVLFEQTHKKVHQRLSKNSDYSKVIESAAKELVSLDEIYEDLKETYNNNVTSHNELIKETLLFMKVFDSTEKEFVL